MYITELFPLLLAPFMIGLSTAVTVEFKTEYYSTTTLVCDDRLLNLPYTTFKKYWILPDGRALQWNYKPSNTSRYVVGDSPAFNLTISVVNDADFGWYYCVILWDNYIYLLHSLKIGLNADGASYKVLLDDYRRNATIGIIAATSVALLLGLLCLLDWCKYSEENTENDENPNKKKDSQSNVNETSNELETADTNEVLAIYELDKAVNGHDDGDEETVAGDGDVTLGISRDQSEIDELADNAPTRHVSAAGSYSTDPNSSTKNISSFKNECDCYGNVPQAPPAPLIPPAPRYFEDIEMKDQAMVFYNRGFDLGAGESVPSNKRDADREKVYVSGGKCRTCEQTI